MPLYIVGLSMKVSIIVNLFRIQMGLYRFYNNGSENSSTKYTILFILMANIIDTARIREVCKYQVNITSMKTIFCKIVKNAKHGIDLL